MTRTVADSVFCLVLVMARQINYGVMVTLGDDNIGDSDSLTLSLSPQCSIISIWTMPKLHDPPAPAKFHIENRPRA